MACCKRSPCSVLIAQCVRISECDMRALQRVAVSEFSAKRVICSARAVSQRVRMFAELSPVFVLRSSSIRNEGASI